MNQATVGIFGRSGDPQVAAVQAQVTRRGGSVAVVDTATGALDRWRLGSDVIATPDGPIEWCGLFVRSMAVRPPRHHPEVVRLAERADWLHRAERGRLRHARGKAMHAALAALGIPVVNPVEAYTLHRSKPATDLRVRAAGLRSPRFVVTDDVQDVVALMAEVGEVVTKPIAGGGTCTAVDPLEGSGERQARLQAQLRLAPGLFQERIRGEDLRLYVVGATVVAALRIETDAVDYRGNERSVRPIEADEVLQDVARRAAAACGLVFSGIDIKRTAEGELVVLDVNPSPMFAAVEARLDLPIAAALAEHLLGDARRRPRPACRPAPLPGNGVPTPGRTLGGCAATGAASPVRGSIGGGAPGGAGAGDGSLLVISEGGDPEVAAVVRAARRHGLRSRVIDLDVERLALDGRGAEARILGPAGVIGPAALVLNRLATSGFGLASPAGLARQPTDSWRLAHLAAREEQGTILAVLEQWERAGAAVVDPVRHVDGTLLRPLRRAELTSLGISVGPSTAAGSSSLQGQVVLVDGEVVIAALRRGSCWRALPVSPATARTLGRAATIVGLRLASLEVEWRRDAALRLTGWTARPRLAALGERLEVDLWSAVLARLTDAVPRPPCGFVTADLVANFAAG